ncbi:hypothetical protein LEN26_015709 [Aphanomyces euteiches]|nr:hypothetical protein LEN26_015709 [Aphanomyces euteiches]KAH9185019.1 hypothetical protein AeNC1_013002 [Aphanomyces euteiches]
MLEDVPQLVLILFITIQTMIHFVPPQALFPESFVHDVLGRVTRDETMKAAKLHRSNQYATNTQLVVYLTALVTICWVQDVVVGRVVGVVAFFLIYAIQCLRFQVDALIM